MAIIMMKGKIKMAIRLVIDSASDILPEEAEAMGMIHVPLTVRFGDEEYRDGVDLTHGRFYEMLVEGDTVPRTSQIPPAVFEGIFSELIEEGDDVVAVTVSSKLSGTYRSAYLAAQSCKGRVFVVDSESVCIGERILIERGLQLIADGLSAEDVARTLDSEKKRVHVLALLDSLEYLKKGGRISSAVAFAGGILGIKPVITVEDGEVSLLGKARGSKQGNNLLRQFVDKVGGIDFDRPAALAYSGLSDTLLQKYIIDSAEVWKGKADDLPVYTVGCTIGTHAGPGAIAVAFFEAEQDVAAPQE